MPTKTLCLSNNKLWVTKDIKVIGLHSGEEMAEGKECYRRNLENKLQQNNLREVWNGKKISLDMKKGWSGDRKGPTSGQWTYLTVWISHWNDLSRGTTIHLLMINKSVDPLQFAYQPHFEVEDAIIFLLHRAYIYLEEVGSTVRVILTFAVLTPYNQPYKGIRC